MVGHEAMSGGRQAREREHFDQLAEATGEIWWGSTTPAGIDRLRRRADSIAHALARFRDPTVLELGCGTGMLTQFVLERVPQLRLVGSDLSSKAVRIAAGRCGGYPHARFCVADVTSMACEPAVFDAVIGNAVLHHLPVERALREILRVLKPGGALALFEPNMLNPQVAIEKNVRVIGRLLQNTEDETAFFRWPLTQTLRRAGFDRVSVQPFDFLHPIVPAPLMGAVNALGRMLEKIPVVREIAGSLLIRAGKPAS
jgi:SAM-dependent methyltransferase